MELLSFIKLHSVLILGAIVGIDNVLAEIPVIKSNSTFQVIRDLVTALFAKPK